MLTKDEVEFARRGGVLWYNTHPRNWYAAAVGFDDDKIGWWAAAVATVAPAKVFVCISHEV